MRFAPYFLLSIYLYPMVVRAEIETPQIKDLMVAKNHSCALFKNGKLKCWGKNNFGQLGLGDSNSRGDHPNEMGSALPYVDLGAGVRVHAVTGGNEHTCALLENNGIRCWGRNREGQLGLGDERPRGTSPNDMGDNLPPVNLGTRLKIKSLVAGHDHNCALFETGQIKCWGANGRGQLGLGDSRYRGFRPNQMGDNLPFVDLGTDQKATTIGLGWQHSCALLESGSVKCWGYNNYGQLGLGHRQDKGHAPNQMGEFLSPIDLGNNLKIKALKSGFNFNCIQTFKGKLKCWGFNAYGHLGQGDNNHRGDNPGEMGENLPFIRMGYGSVIKKTACSGTHTCVILENRSLKCWGFNTYGQLGLGDADHRGDQPKEMGDQLVFVNLGKWSQVNSVFTNYYHSCALLHDGQLKCWGDNRFGQLGLGDKVARGSLTSQMGDQLPSLKFF